MSRTIKRGTAASSSFKGSADSFKHDNDRTKRHNQIVYGLDKDYNRQLKHLKHVARKASLRFNKFNRTHTNDLDELN
jgi:hypothetical protein